MISPGVPFPGGFCNPLNGQFRIVLPVVIFDLDTDIVTRSRLNRDGLQDQPAVFRKQNAAVSACSAGIFPEEHRIFGNDAPSGKF